MDSVILTFPADPSALAAPACSLSPDSMRERAGAWASLRDRYLIERTRSENRAMSRWQGEGLVEVQALVEAERDCCPFLAFTLTLGEEWIELETMFPDGVSSGLFPDVG